MGCSRIESLPAGRAEGGEEQPMLGNLGDPPFRVPLYRKRERLGRRNAHRLDRAIRRRRLDLEAGGLPFP